MPTDEEVRHFRRYYPDSNLMHWYQKGYNDALREARRDIGSDFSYVSTPYGPSIRYGLEEPKKTKRKSNRWNTFLKRFNYRKKKPRESNKNYFKARTKAASKKYKRIKK